MKRAAIYSSTRAQPAAQPAAEPEPAVNAEVEKKIPFSWRGYAQRHRRGLRIAAGAAAALVIGAGAWIYGPALRGATPAEVDAAIQRALESVPPKPTVAEAYEKIL